MDCYCLLDAESISMTNNHDGTFRISAKNVPSKDRNDIVVGIDINIDRAKIDRFHYEIMCSEGKSTLSNFSVQDER